LPVRLRDLSAPPRVAYLRGELPRGPAVAIIGTRKASLDGIAFTRQLVRDLVDAGVAILSGGAKGIDRAAHFAALRAGGVTVVVAPSGFDAPYPRRHARLYAQVLARGGAYLSLVPSHVRPTLPAFHIRNAALVALAHAVVVVQAPVVSGAINAARAARRVGRPVFVVPSAPWDPLGGGCLVELELGARPLVKAAQILKTLADLRVHAVPPSPFGTDAGHAPDPGTGTNPHALAAQSGTLALPFDEGRVLLNLLRSGATHPDSLAERTGWEVRRIQQLLLTLTLDGVVVSDPAGRVRIVSD
jgi:DNA processing protein